MPYCGLLSTLYIVYAAFLIAAVNFIWSGRVRCLYRNLGTVTTSHITRPHAESLCIATFAPRTTVLPRLCAFRT